MFSNVVLSCTETALNFSLCFFCLCRSSPLFQWSKQFWDRERRISRGACRLVPSWHDCLALPVFLLSLAIILVPHTWTWSRLQISSDLVSTVTKTLASRAPVTHASSNSGPLCFYCSCCLGGFQLRYLSHPLPLSRSLPTFSGHQSIIPICHS